MSKVPLFARPHRGDPLLPLWLQLLALTLPAPALAEAPIAVVPVPAVLHPEDDEPEVPPVDVLVDAVTVRITPGEESYVELDVALRALDPGWVDLAVTGGALAVSSARLDGEAVALADRQGGARWLTTELTGQHRLRVRGTVATPTDALDLPLPLASRARVVITEPGWDLTVEGGIPAADGSVLLASSQRLAARWKPHAAPAPKPRVVTVQSATAVSFDESGLEGHSVLRYRVAHGSLEQVSFDITGSPDSVEVSGPAVLDHSVRGQRVTVRLARPMEGGFELQVAFRAPAPSDADAHPAPLVSPREVFEHSGWVTVARADTAMLVPEPGAGLTPIPGSSLPDWATGLVPGDPVVSYTLSGRRQALDYRLMSYDPGEAPPTVVDEARFQLAATAHGRVLMKARYTVRNDRNQYLRLAPPAGFDVLGVRVAGQVRQPVADEAGTGDAVYIPLEKSVESLQGLISFPVEVYLLGDEAAWDKKGERSLQTPAVDAPVAYARWEVWLPTDVEWEELSGLPKHVSDWTSSEHSLEYGRAVKTGDDGDDGSWEDEDGVDDIQRVARASRRSPRKARPDDAKDKAGAVSSSYQRESEAEDASLELFNMAYQAYNSNDFDQAQVLLEQSLQLDEGNASAHALLGNVYVVMGETGGENKADQAQAQRVRDLARARAVDEELEQEEARKKAEEALRAGDLEQAERELARLEEVTRELSRYEQGESVEQRMLLEETEKQLQDTRGKLAKKQKQKAPVAVTQTSSSTAVVGGSMGWDAGGDEIMDIPDRYVELVVEEPAPEMAMPSAAPYPEPVIAFGRDTAMAYDEPAEPMPYPEAEPYPAAEPYPEGDELEALHALGYVDEYIDEEEEEYWDDDEVYFEDLDIEPDVHYAQPASMESYRRGGRVVGAVGDAVGGAVRGAGRLFSRSKNEPERAAPVQPVYPRPADSGEYDRSSHEEGRRVEYKARTEIDFEDVTVEGELTKPQGQLLLDRQQANYDPLIQLRTDFDGELADGTTVVTGGGMTGLDADARWDGSGPSEPLLMDFGTQAAGKPDPSTMEYAPRIHTLDSALQDINGALDRTRRLEERARDAGDIERVQGLRERTVSIQALQQVAAQSAAELLLADQAGDHQRADHERRKMMVALDKVQQFEGEAQAIDAGTYATSVGTVAVQVEADQGILGSLSSDLTGGIGGLIGAKGTQTGSGGLGSRGSGLGGGGTAEGLGGLGTRGRGSGASGYGAGAAKPRASVDAPPPPPPQPTPAPVAAAPMEFGPPPAAPLPASGRSYSSEMAVADAEAPRGPVTTARRVEVVTTPPGGTTALPEPSQTVSAAHMTINIPKAGERLAFEQLLVAENEPMTIDIRYRTRSRR